MRTNQRLHPIPDFWITFNLDVCLHEDPVKPGISCATVRGRLIAEPKITEDLCAGCIGGANYRCAVKKAVHLIKIRGFGVVGGNESVGFADFVNAVYLNSEEDWNA